MDQTTASSWKLLPWHLLGGSQKKPRSARSPRKVSPFRRRLQAHAAITRSLSPFCARASFDSLVMPVEENKCLVSLSAFMNACRRCAFRDVHVPLGPPLRSPRQQKAYIKAIHHHLHETSVHLPVKTTSSRRAHHHVNTSHVEKLHARSEPHELMRLQRDQDHELLKHSKKGESMKRLEAYECKENDIKAQRQCRQDEGIARAEVKVRKCSKSHCRRQEYSFVDGGENIQTESAHHFMPSSSSLSRKGNGTSTLRKTKDVYVCTTTHVPEQHRGKIKAFNEEGIHNHIDEQLLSKELHQNRNEDPPIMKNTHHNHAITDPPLKSKHHSVRKSQGVYGNANEDPQFWQHQHTSKNLSLRYLSFKRYNASKDPLPLNYSEAYANRDLFMSLRGSASYANKDLLGVKLSESYTNKSSYLVKPSESYANNPLLIKASEFYANEEPLSLKGSESCANKEPLSLKGSESHTNKDHPLKVAPSPAYKHIDGDINDTGRKRQDHEKIKLARADHQVSDGIWMQDTLPIVKYSLNPYADFHNSMLEMLLKRGLKDFHELQDMFACYVLLNSPCNQKHIEKAFGDLLTDLYKCKLMSSLQIDEI